MSPVVKLSDATVMCAKNAATGFFHLMPQTARRSNELPPIAYLNDELII